MKQHTNYLNVGILLSLTILFPGCDWFNVSKTTEAKKSTAAPVKSEPTAPSGIEYPDASDKSDVIATINGKPLVTVAMVEKQFQEALKDPQLSELLAMNPGIEADVKKQLIQALVTPAIISAHVYGKGLDKTPEYKARLADLIKNATQMANIELFQKGLNVHVSDADVRAFYEEHKNQIPGLVVSRGGVKAQGVSFANETDARAFAEKVKGKNSEFEKIAQESNLGKSFKDFKLVNAASPAVDAAIRGKLMEITTFPKIAVMKASDGTVWIINAISKEEAKYAPFEEVKEQLAPYVKQEKEQGAAQKAIEDYKKELKIEIKDTYFQDQAGRKSADAIEQLKEAIMMEQQTAAPEKAAAARAV